MIYTVFFINDDEMTHDCETYEEAVEYGEEKGKDYIIEATDGEVV